MKIQTQSNSMETGRNQTVCDEDDEIWAEIQSECRGDAAEEPILARYLHSTVLSHVSLENSLAFHLANKLSSPTLCASQLFGLIAEAFAADARIRECIRADLKAFRERDTACISYSQCLLYFKGFQACQAYRVSHRLWKQGRISMALAIHSRICDVFCVDIHPKAVIGKGLFLDHATGLVVGETARIGDKVSIMHNVTLGGTGKTGGDRHPKVGDGVLIGAGAIVLGNIMIGDGAKIGAGAVVLNDVPKSATAVGNPARLVRRKGRVWDVKDAPCKTMNHAASRWHHWSDYVI